MVAPVSCTQNSLIAGTCLTFFIFVYWELVLLIGVLNLTIHVGIGSIVAKVTKILMQIDFVLEMSWYIRDCPTSFGKFEIAPQLSVN